MNEKREEDRRVEKPFMVDRDVMEYLELKGGLFERGKRSGRSEALNRCVRFCMDYEKGMGV